jgi:SUN domain-containing protein 1/2
MKAARLLQSIANLHNALLLIVIFTFLYVSILPIKGAKNLQANASVREAPEVSTCGNADVDNLTCSAPDLSKYEHMLKNYEKLRQDFIDTRETAATLMQSKLALIDESISSLSKLEVDLQTTLDSVRRRQSTLAFRIEKIQKRIAVPRNITRIDEKIVEISGSCPLFQIQDTLEYRQLQTRLDDTNVSLQAISAQYEQLRQHRLSSQQWLSQLSSALPIMKDLIAKSPMNSVAIPSLENMENRIASLVQNEIHDQWKATKSSQDTFLELYRISAETIETFTERWQAEIEQKHNEQLLEKAKLSPKAPKLKRMSTTEFHMNRGTTSENASGSDGVSHTPVIDYALGSSGASIVVSETSETYIPTVSNLAANPGLLGEFSHGISKALLGAGPEDAISSIVKKGSCWPMLGSTGALTVQLSTPVLLNAITLDHFVNSDDMTSAPRTFHVYVKADNAKSTEWQKVLGWEEFDATKGTTTYTIPPNSQRLATQVKLEVVENYGHPFFTCIYRFRVHGTPL